MRKLFLGLALAMVVALAMVAPAMAAGDQPPADVTYIIRPGDTLSRLAKVFGLSVGELVDANRIANPDLIITGDELRIPGVLCRSMYGWWSAQGWAPYSGCKYYGAPYYQWASSMEVSSMVEAGEFCLEEPESDDGLWWAETWSRSCGGCWPPTGDYRVVYTIRPGDTLGELAKVFGFSIEELAEANGIADPDYIVAWALLYIPAPGD